MLIYALQGKRNTGKSLTLATLFVKIIHEYKDKVKSIYPDQNYDTEFIEKKIARKYQAICAKRHCASPYVSTVLEIEGVLVGIHTSGDDKSSIQKAMSLFKGEATKGEPCDIAFGACHLWGITVREIEGLCQNGNQLKLIPKEIPKNATCEIFKQYNTCLAEDLFKKLQEYIESKAN